MERELGKKIAPAILSQPLGTLHRFRIINLNIDLWILFSKCFKPH
jgi:hypothetical protein